MAQNTDLFLSTRHYTRSDYTALRSYCLNIPFATITRLYYTEDSPQVIYGLEKYLLDMRDDLVERALLHNPHLAKSLQHARQGGKMTDAALRILRNAADIPAPVPHPDQPVALWFRPKTVTALQQEGISTIAELMSLIERRGSGWWRAVPRIGRLRAQVLLRWCQANATTLGSLVLDSPAPTPAAHTPLVSICPQQPSTLAPLGRFTTSALYDGSQGINRASQFCFIQAKNDLEAVEFYLSRYVDQPHTLRAYRKELERFLLWAIVGRGKPLSSLLVDDCEAYKSFLINPSSAFTGSKAPRFSTRWRPFQLKPMSAKSQRHAIRILRATFDYLVGVRYLSGNPWIAVKDPSVRKDINLLQVHKALPSPLWKKLIAALERYAAGPGLSAVQYRIALAICLLMGDSGLRREEAATVKRHDLIKSMFGENVYELRVTGKGNKERLVPVSQRTMNALRAHWNDRSLDLMTSPADFPLIAPVIIPLHAQAQQRHALPASGYHVNNVSRLLKTTLQLVFNDPLSDFNEEERQQLFSTTAHHLRHTFGTLSVADGMPIDVAQSILGHASPGTTAIYVQAKKQRIMEEASRFFVSDSVTISSESN